MNLWIAISAIIAISGVLAWGTYMIGFRSTGRHADQPFIQDDAPWNVIQSMQLSEEFPFAYKGSDRYADDIADSGSRWHGMNAPILEDFYPLTEYVRESTMDDMIIGFYELQESITEIGIPAGW